MIYWLRLPAFASVIGFMLFAYSAQSYAEGPNFIAQRALDPFTQRFGLPAAAQRIKRNQRLQLSVDYSNVFMGGNDQDVERLFLDGETAQLTLRYDRKLSACWQLNVSGEWLSHSGGQFDSAIQSWHSAFNLPNAQRDLVPTDQLVYSYSNAVTGDQGISEPSSGYADMQVHLLRYKHCDSRSSLWRFGVKLPLGNEQEFIGSSQADYFIDWQSPWWKRHASAKLRWAVSAGLLLPAQYDETPEQRPLVAFGNIGIDYSMSRKLSLLAQLEWHTPFFKSELTELGRVAGQASLGFRYSALGGLVELSFAEDVVIDTAPDFVLRLAWSRDID